jgi:hypothetical protein
LNNELSLGCPHVLGVNITKHFSLQLTLLLNKLARLLVDFSGMPNDCEQC